MCSTEIQRLERCVISDKVWHYTVWVKPDDFFIYERKSYIATSISCLYVYALSVCQGLWRQFSGNSTPCRKNYPALRKRTVALETSTLILSRRAQHKFLAAQTLASVKPEVEEAQSFELLLKSRRTSSRPNRYPLQLVTIQMTLCIRSFQVFVKQKWKKRIHVFLIPNVPLTSVA